MVAGKKIEMILRDDAGVADNARRLVQEMIVNDKVQIIGWRHHADRARLWPARDPGEDGDRGHDLGSLGHDDRIALLRAHQFHPGAVVLDHGRVGGEERQQEGGDAGQRVGARAPKRKPRSSSASPSSAAQIVELIRIPLANPDFAPFLQRIRDINPDTAFIYFPGTQAGIFAKQFAERGLANSGIKIIGPGDLTDDDELNTMGDQMLGMVTAHDYSASHDSALNKKYVEDFKKANNFRPNFVSVGGYDGMHLIYEALKKTGGKTDGDTLLAAMKGMRWESPRGMMSIDPDTRDIVQPIYIRKVEKLNGELWNTEFAKFDDVKDPLKVKK